ncbi:MULTISPECIES: hypothetical protein [unclassified Leucobacter]
MSENATSALIKRAREAFKIWWLAVHLDSDRASDPECREIIPSLPR